MGRLYGRGILKAELKFVLHLHWSVTICRLSEEKPEEEKKTTIDNSKEAAIEAEVQAARQRAVVPLEIRMKQFRDMLAEKDVSWNWLIGSLLEYWLIVFYVSL